MRLVIVLCAALGVVLSSGFAAAQTAQGIAITINPAGIQRTKKSFSHPKGSEFWINYPDCRGDNGFIFPINITNALPATGNFEVWSGSSSVDCTQQVNRKTTVNCTRLYSARPSSRQFDVTVSAIDITAGFLYPSAYVPGTGTPAICDQSTGSGAEHEIAFWFMFLEADQVLTTVTPTQYKTKIDVERPTPPSNVTAGAGENRLVLSFKGSDSGDRAGYRFYCERAVSSGSDAGTGSNDAAASDGSAATASPLLAADDSGIGAGGTAGAPDVDASAGTGGTGGTGGTAGDGGTGATDSDASDDAGGSSGTGSTSGPPAVNLSCPTVVLSAPNPPASYECGSISGTTTSGDATGLENNATYAVAVATVDKAGNVGPLSSIACGVPVLVTDFFESYRDAGGKGGGGFCSLGHRHASGAALFVIGALVMGTVLRRRSR